MSNANTCVEEGYTIAQKIPYHLINMWKTLSVTSIQYIFTWTRQRKILKDATNGKINSKTCSMFDLMELFVSF